MQYAPVHRHLGDEVYLATQQRDQVDVALRRLAQDFQEVRNYVYERTLTFFRAPARTRVVVCQDENMRVVTEARRLHFPASIVQCYDTTGGVGGGVSVSAGDIERKRSGLPWWIIPIGVVAVFCVALVVPRYVTGAVSRVVSAGRVKHAQVTPVPAGAVAVEDRSGISNGPVRVLKTEVVLTNKSVRVASWSSDRRGITVWTDDGQRFSSRDRPIAMIGGKFFVGTNTFEIPPGLR